MKNSGTTFKAVLAPESKKIDFQASLNNEQYQAVTSKGPTLVLAGAGTGKTRVLVYRVAWLIEQGVDPRSIVLLTFTKKAADEMLNRVSILVNKNIGRMVAGGTFHSFANTILRQFAKLLGLDPNFIILDNPDSEDVIDKIRTDLGYNSQQTDFPYKQRIFEIISISRNKLISIEEVVKTKFSGLKEYIPDLELISNKYAEFKKANSLLDFDDMIEFLVIALKENPLFKKIINRRFKYVLVDEFQDTNTMQFELVKLLSPKDNNVMAVGDDMQSIYAFRGANYENIFQLSKSFTDCKIIKLEQNYRSQPALLEFTNEIIEKAQTAYPKKLWSKKKPGPKTQVCSFIDTYEEAEFIADKIRSLKETGIPTSEIAILSRNGHCNITVQLELSKRGIPYAVFGGSKFTERKHVKDIMAYLRIAQNIKDVIAWHRVLKLLPGVGPKNADKILAFLKDDGSFENIPESKYTSQVRELGLVIKRILPDEVPLIDKIEHVKSHYIPLLEQKDKDSEPKKIDINMIQQMSAQFSSVEKFISDFTLNPPSKQMVPSVGPVIDETEEPPVVVSTIHSAKGLEWHTVFVIHALEGTIPSSKAMFGDEVEEERRLFYVACTRAKENLFVTYPSYLPGYNAYYQQPSRFLSELDENTFEIMDKIYDNEEV